MSGTVQTRSHNPWDDIYNFDDLCRLCGKRDTKMVSIFDNQSKHDFRVMINRHFLDFQVTESDTLPKKICGKCKATLTLWHGFHQKCLTTNTNFLNVLSKMTKTSTESQSTISSSADETKTTIPHSDDAVKNDVLDPSIEVIEVKIADDDVIHTYTISDSDNDDEVIPADVKDIQVSNVEMDADPLGGTSDLELGIEEVVPEIKNVAENIVKIPDKKGAKSTNANVQERKTQMALTVEQPSSSSNKTTNVNKLAHQSSNCRICGKSFNDRNVYLRHLLRSHTNLSAMSKKSNVDTNNAANSVNTSPKIFKKSATSRLQKKKRIRPPRKQDESDPVMCDLCGKTFVFRSSYHKHVREQHSDGPPPSKPKRARRMCDLCGQICSASSFNGHMKKHTNPELLTCEYCNMVFSFDSVLRSHMKVKHSNERPYKCNQCDAAFKRADYLRSHQRYKHHPKEPRYLRDENGRRFYTCGSCDSRFKSVELLEQHRASNTKNGELQCCSSFHCTECNASYKKRNYLLLHTRYVHGKNQKFSISEASVGPYKCDRCDRRFASVCGRNYHCKSVHGSVYNSKFTETCDHCGLTFRNRVFYAKHRARIRDRPTCWMCWTEYDTDELLKEHVNRDHVDDLPFECNECNCRFMAMRQLNEHVRSKHMKIRPFKCDYCDHAAIRKDSLEIHIRCCHLMIRPFKCDLCERAFAQASDLRKHRITHTRSLVRVKKQIKPKEETLKLETLNVASLIELNPENFDDLVE